MATATEPDLIDRYIELHDRQAQLEADLKAVKAEIETANEALVEDWAETGTSQIVRTGRTVKLSASWTEFHCWKSAGVSTPALCEGLLAAGLPGMVRREPSYDASKLKSWIWEQQKEGAELPSGLSRLLDVGITPKVRVK